MSYFDASLYYETLKISEEIQGKIPKHALYNTLTTAVIKPSDDFFILFFGWQMWRIYVEWMKQFIFLLL